MGSRVIFLSFVCATAALAGPPGADADRALERLIAGNRAYVAGRHEVKDAGAARRAETAGGQHPFAAVLSCADSRVPPELIFNEGIGDLFVVRVAGAVADQAVLGSLEYGAEHLHVPLIVVMGHLSCGAVKSAMDSGPPAHLDPAGMNLERILSAIRPAVSEVPPETPERWTKCVLASVEHTLRDVVSHSPVLAELQEKGQVKIAGAVYDVRSGRVDFLKPEAHHAGRH